MNCYEGNGVMSIYAISDLHLAKSIDKPMDIFGPGWSDYMTRLKRHWEEMVSVDDAVIIPGDVSWATYLAEIQADFDFIENLPGQKIISKGNHDYWWTSMNKLNQFMEERQYKTIHFMHNNAYEAENMIICGTRGWKCPGEDQFSDKDMKIYMRELQRLEISLKSAQEMKNKGQNGSDKEILVAMHFPPFTPEKKKSAFVDLMKEYGVKQCIYGHLHAHSIIGAVQGDVEDIHFKLVSADYLEFKPLKLWPAGKEDI